MWDLDLRPKLGTSQPRGPEHLTGLTTAFSHPRLQVDASFIFVVVVFFFSPFVLFVCPPPCRAGSVNAPSCPTRPSRKKNKKTTLISRLAIYNPRIVLAGYLCHAFRKAGNFLIALNIFCTHNTVGGGKDKKKKATSCIRKGRFWTANGVKQQQKFHGKQQDIP